jgi:hypothetical protein
MRMLDTTQSINFSALLLGSAAALLLVAIAGLKPRLSLPVYAIGLAAAAIVYLAFAAAGGATLRWISVEALGVLLFGLTVWLGLQRSSVILALGWSLHVLWDLLHLAGARAAYTPGWYPWSCLSFDLIVAVAILTRSHNSGITRSDSD